MIRKTSLAAVALLSLAAASQPAGAYERLPRALARLSPADFAAQVRIVDDPVERAVVLSTSDGYKRGRSIKGAHADDVHLRALVDKRTGRVSWQVWHDLAYVGGRKELGAVHYEAGGQLRQAQPLSVDHWPDRCPPTDQVGICSEGLRVVFELPEQAVREIAASYRPGARAPWRLRFKDGNGRDVTGGLAPAEAAGLLHALEGWQRGSPRAG